MGKPSLEKRLIAKTCFGVMASTTLLYGCQNDARQRNKTDPKRSFIDARCEQFENVLIGIGPNNQEVFEISCAHIKSFGISTKDNITYPDKITKKVNLFYLSTIGVYIRRKRTYL